MLQATLSRVHGAECAWTLPIRLCVSEVMRHQALYYRQASDLIGQGVLYKQIMPDSHGPESRACAGRRCGTQRPGPISSYLWCSLVTEEQATGD